MILNLYKPKGLTSHDVVNRVRRITGEKKVGHGGTLDPLAEGVLIVAVGRNSTKKLAPLLKTADKEYLATIELGKTSSTDDAEGEIQQSGSLENIMLKKIQSVLEKFKGSLEQAPPRYSAVKIKGTPAYKLARAGKDFGLKSKVIRIKSLEIVRYKPPLLEISVVASSGTYIRSLARDIGKTLGVGGYLKDLKRTRVGDFPVSESLTLEKLAKAMNLGDTKDI